QADLDELGKPAPNIDPLDVASLPQRESIYKRELALFGRVKPQIAEILRIIDSGQASATGPGSPLNQAVAALGVLEDDIQSFDQDLEGAQVQEITAVANATSMSLRYGFLSPSIVFGLLTLFILLALYLLQRRIV